MTSEQLKIRRIRSTNMEIDLYKDLQRFRNDNNYKSISDLVEELFNFYLQKNKKLGRKE